MFPEIYVYCFLRNILFIGFIMILEKLWILYYYKVLIFSKINNYFQEIIEIFQYLH